MFNVPPSIQSAVIKFSLCWYSRPSWMVKRFKICFRQPRLATSCKGYESDAVLRIWVLFQLVSTPSFQKRESHAGLGKMGNVSFKMDYNSHLLLKAAEYLKLGWEIQQLLQSLMQHVPNLYIQWDLYASVLWQSVYCFVWREMHTPTLITLFVAVRLKW